jgi:PST family polysaccharide transporter
MRLGSRVGAENWSWEVSARSFGLLEGPLLQRSRLGANIAFTLAGQWSRTLVQLGSLVVFSRLLAPHDLGIVAMVTSVITIAGVFGDMGLSVAAIQAKDLSAAQKSNLFWVNALLGTGAGLVVFCISGLLAQFYREPAVTPVSMALSTVFVANGLAVQYRVELNRRGRFALIALIDACSQLLGFSIGAVFATLGGRYWALVVFQVIVAFSTFIALASATRWRPGRPQRDVGTRPLVRFGFHVFVAQLMTNLAANVDSLVVGRFSGSAALGYYNRAYQLAFAPSQQISSPLTRVLMPDLARKAGVSSAFEDAVLSLQRVSGYLICGLLSLLAGLAGPIVWLVLGPNWSNTAALVRLLALASAFAILGNAFYWMLLARARTKLLVAYEFWPRLVMLALIVAAGAAGPRAVAGAAAVGQFLMLAASISIVLPSLQLKRLPFTWITARPVVVYAVCTCVAWVSATSVERLSHGTLNELVSLAGGLLAWGAAFMIFLLVPQIRRDAQEVRRRIRAAFNNR